ncbi:MAG: phosphate ABC transporter permease PstA [Pseudonocardia sp.]|nr:phosphate ABC transporter permease PstA [Pseudonocardia sp.]
MDLNAPATDSLLLRRALPRWSSPAVALAAVALTALLFALTPLSGRVEFLLVAVIVFIAVDTGLVTVVEGWRHGKNRLMTSLLISAAVVAVLPLLAVLGYTIVHGLQRFGPFFLTHSMRGVAEQDTTGGAYHAIIGTLQQVGLATLIAVPFGLMVAIYLVEYGAGERLARAVSFFVDVMTGLPSIVAGLFILALWILALHQDFSGFAGALALIILMLPTVVRSAEEMLKIVPGTLREASYALGIPKWVTIARIVLPTALPGIVTGIMLAIARVMGETAPLLVTVFGNTAINNNPFHGPQSALPLFVFSEAGLPNDTAIARAWAGALTLIVIVLLLNIVARTIARFTRVS